MFGRNFSFGIPFARKKAFGLVAGAMQSNRKFSIEMLGDASCMLSLKCRIGMMSLLYGGDNALVSVIQAGEHSEVRVMAEPSPSYLSRGFSLFLAGIGVECSIRGTPAEPLNILLCVLCFCYALSLIGWMFAGGAVIKEVVTAVEKQMEKEGRGTALDQLERECAAFGNETAGDTGQAAGEDEETAEFDAQCAGGGEMLFKCPRCGNFVRHGAGTACRCPFCSAEFEIE